MAGSEATHGVSSVIEDYVLAIYRLQSTGEQVLGARLAEHLGVAPASVTEMLGRLRREALVEPDRPVRLSPAGLALARTLVSRHRLVERFLVDTLGFGWDEVHEEAHRLEHALSAAVTERLSAFLGHPSTCPHGHPIMEDGAAEPDLALQPLTRLAVGASGRVRRIAYEDPELLRLLRDRGIGLDTPVRLEGVEPWDGPVRLVIDGRTEMLGRAAAEAVLIET